MEWELDLYVDTIIGQLTKVITPRDIGIENRADEL